MFSSFRWSRLTSSRIYGGGYTLGSKDWYDPSGLIKASQANGGQGIIYVAMNYRLGAMGWLAGSTMKESGGTPNAGFHDQRLAIEWVRDNIHLFGGDASQITIMGESAGGKLKMLNAFDVLLTSARRISRAPNYSLRRQEACLVPEGHSPVSWLLPDSHQRGV